MIAATYNCGCPKPKQSSLITEPIGLQTPCSPCCFRPYGASPHSRGQTIQRFTQSAGVDKWKCIYPAFKERISGCNDRKKALPYSEHISSAYLSSTPFQCFNCCAMSTSRMHSTLIRRPISAATSSASKENTNRQFSRSKSESKLEEREIPNAKQTPTEKVVSEIVRKGQPYKEIEAVINDNRVIIRMHKEPIKEEYDPPCECIGQTVAEESMSTFKKCEGNVVFDMAEGNLELSRGAPRVDASSMKETCDREEIGCRTVTLYPNIKDGDPSSHMETERVRKLKTKRPIDFEENPNIFLLRIRKHRDSGDKRQKIDLEFRAPRPWQRRNDEKKEPLTHLIEKDQADEEKYTDKQDDDRHEEDWDKEDENKEDWYKED